MDLGTILNDDAGEDDPDDLLRRLPPVPIIPDTPQTQLTVLKSEPSKTCPHGLVRYLEPCAQCWEQLQYDAYGWALDSRHDPWRPNGTICVHQVEIKSCKMCWGRRLCEHKRESRYCVACGRARLCIVCRKHVVIYAGTTCKTCQAEQEGRKIHRGRKTAKEQDEDAQLVARVTAKVNEEFDRMKSAGQTRLAWYVAAAEERVRRGRLLRALAEARKERAANAANAHVNATPAAAAPI